MPPRQGSQRHHLEKGPPKTPDQNQLPFQHPSTQALPTIVEALENSSFNSIPEIQLQPANMSTTIVGTSQNGGGTSSTQTNKGD
jgi:hypothetical protein